MTTGTPSVLITTLRFLTLMVASTPGPRRSTARHHAAAPPMWKVRMVSWVPGSPIDWAAITPTASPTLTGGAAGQIAAVAGPQTPLRRLAGQHGTDAHLDSMPGPLDRSTFFLDEPRRP